MPNAAHTIAGARDNHRDAIGNPRARCCTSRIDFRGSYSWFKQLQASPRHESVRPAWR